MIVEPLTAAHARRLVPQPGQAADLARLGDPATLADLGPAWAALDGERVLAVGGLIIKMP